MLFFTEMYMSVKRKEIKVIFAALICILVSAN